MCQASHRAKLLVDRVRGQPSGFEVHAIANHHDAIKGQAGLGTVPGNELIDGVVVHAARGWRSETVEHRTFAVIQIGQSQHSATVIWLDSPFAHGDGPPAAVIGTTAARHTEASLLGDVS